MNGPFVFGIGEGICLNDCLDVVYRIDVGPETQTSDNSCEERSEEINVSVFCVMLNDGVVEAEIEAKTHGFPDEGWPEAKKKLFQAMLLEYSGCHFD